jgi:hypothetical protein
LAPSIRCITLTYLPSEEAFDATLEFVRSKELPPIDYRLEKGAACLLGALANAQYLQIKALTDECCQALEEILVREEGSAEVLGNPFFNTEVVPAGVVCSILAMEELSMLSRLKVCGPRSVYSDNRQPAQQPAQL